MAEVAVRWPVVRPPTPWFGVPLMYGAFVGFALAIPICLLFLLSVLTDNSLFRWLFVPAGAAAVLALVFLAYQQWKALRVEVTADRATFLNRRVRHTVPVAELGTVAVIHTGTRGRGYERTLLRIAGAPRHGTLIVGGHEPELAACLEQVLGPGVGVVETWEPLVEPPEVG